MKKVYNNPTAFVVDVEELDILTASFDVVDGVGNLDENGDNIGFGG